jgi:hypothetical protein
MIRQVLAEDCSACVHAFAAMHCCVGGDGGGDRAVTTASLITLIMVVYYALPAACVCWTFAHFMCCVHRKLATTRTPPQRMSGPQQSSFKSHGIAGARLTGGMFYS